jgi:hypothetical protein
MPASMSHPQLTLQLHLIVPVEATSPLKVPNTALSGIDPFARR